MNGAQHYAEAVRLIGEAQDNGEKMLQKALASRDVAHLTVIQKTLDTLIATAQVHAILALVPAVTEIGDQLDTKGGKA